MKILHTSDWHLGQNFMGKSREEEHKAFFGWLCEVIEKEAVDVLIVAGDIFDTRTPPNYALELYYNFLKTLSNSLCKYIIITAGNHDSIATLKAPKQLLSVLNVYVVTSGDESENQLIEIVDGDKLQGVVCAVPFLRDGVVRKSQNGQTMSEKEFSLIEGIKEHYDRIYKDAKKLLDGRELPIIATGHLTTVGAKSSDSEREIYIGGSLDIDSDFFGKKFDYVALGHLHNNQKVGKERVFYSGSPISLSFSESTSQKRVNIVTFSGKDIKVREIDIPLFRPLVVIYGDLERVLDSLEKIEDKDSWIEVHLDDSNPFASNQKIREVAQTLSLTILALKIDNREKINYLQKKDMINLDELSPLDVFNYRLDADTLLDEKLKKELINNFKIILDKVEMQ